MLDRDSSYSESVRSISRHSDSTVELSKDHRLIILMSVRFLAVQPVLDKGLTRKRSPNNRVHPPSHPYGAFLLTSVILAQLYSSDGD